MPKRKAKERNYVFAPSDPSIFCEIYFPFYATYQGTIFDALKDSAEPGVVKLFLQKEVEGSLVDDLRPYGGGMLLDPNRILPQDETVSGSEKILAQRRIKLYRSPYAGNSMYHVHGMFFYGDESHVVPAVKPQLAEEDVQVVRLMFRFGRRDQQLLPGKDTVYQIAQENRAIEALRVVVRWLVRNEYLLSVVDPWHEAHRVELLNQIAHWQEDERTRHYYDYVERHFQQIAKETDWWICDCALFIFGYLVRKFSTKVLTEGRKEDEIWVTSFFDLNINSVTKPMNGVPLFLAEQ